LVISQKTSCVNQIDAQALFVFQPMLCLMIFILVMKFYLIL